jgi:hypothetical protein
MLPPCAASHTGLFAGGCVSDESERMPVAKDPNKEAAGLYQHPHCRMLLLVQAVNGSLAPAGRT